VSIRRRNIADRVERERLFNLGRSEADASLERMRRVIAEALAAGKTSITRHEFWTHYHALKDPK
jgi:hypothetical protein